MRLKAGVGSGEVLEVALVLRCRSGRGRGVGASGVELGLELGAAGLQVRGGCSVREYRCSRRDTGLLQLAREGWFFFLGGGVGGQRKERKVREGRVLEEGARCPDSTQRAALL